MGSNLRARETPITGELRNVIPYIWGDTRKIFKKLRKRYSLGKIQIQFPLRESVLRFLEARRTGSIVFGRAFGTRIMGQPS